MGAVPGGGLLTEELADAAKARFDVDVYRPLGRTVVLRDVDRPVVVLGSTQPRSVLDDARAAATGVEVARRRSGGGAVLLVPGRQVWADVWIPRDDPLWSDEPRRMAVSVGEWWASALGAPGGAVHRGGSVAARGSDVVCFAGVGPGEVLVAGRKLVGLAQWRSRQGALVHGCAYRVWEPEPLIDLLVMDGRARRLFSATLATAAIGLDAIGVAPTWGAGALEAALPDGPPWDVRVQTAFPGVPEP